MVINSPSHIGVPKEQLVKIRNMNPFKTYNSFAELAAVNNTQPYPCVTRNSQLASLIQDYDRIVKNLESTEQLISTAAQTAQPEVQAELIRPKTKYETELLKAKQKILDELQTTPPDDFDRSILSAASDKTKTDLTPLLANTHANTQPKPETPKQQPQQPAQPPPAPPVPAVESDPAPTVSQ